MSSSGGGGLRHPINDVGGLLTHSNLVSRVIAPGIALWGVIVIIGLVLTRPGTAINTSENSISLALEGARTDRWNYLTLIWSHFGGTELVIGVCIIVAGLVLGVTKSWKLAAVPVLAISLQEVIFLAAAGVVDRPRPLVARIDVSPPTTSYPSGHVGASTALYVAFCLIAIHIERTWLRWLTIVTCPAVPILVAFARLYRGMHYLSDIGAAIVNGLSCALLAYWWYRSADRASEHETAPMSAARSGAQRGHAPPVERGEAT
jgi:membrane-associated phospholipid phosphatase